MLGKNKFWNIGFLLCLFVLSPNGFAQNIIGKATWDKDSITIGDRVNLKIEIDVNDDSQLDWIPLTDSIGSNIEILEYISRDTIRYDGDKYKLEEQYYVTSFDSGVHQPRPYLVTTTKAWQHDTTYMTIPPLYVSLVPADTSIVIYDIKPVYKAPLTAKETIMYSFLVLLVVIMGYMLYKYFKKRNFSHDNEDRSVLKIILPPHILAIRDLDSLREEKLWQVGKVKDYYTRLTDIIRVYLKQRFGVSATEMTTYEILSALKTLRFEDNELMNILKDLFETADLVKFAKGNPIATENETCMLNAYMFVNKTKEEQLNIPSANENKSEKDTEQSVNNKEVF